MTDTSLPNHQNPVSSGANPAHDPQSYVDSYAPPASQATPSPVPPVPPMTSAPASQQPSTDSAHDPLAELEKALKEYEERQKQLAEKKEETVQKTEAVVQDSPEDDPLKELERVLDEYEAKFKQDEIVAAEPASVSTSSPSAPATPPPITEANGVQPEKIEEQNIFELLGVVDADTAEKEAFLDELQTALWEDFLDKDLALLVTENQLKEVRDLRAQTSLPENERQEKLIQKVESIVPDIEDIMLEKALELKEEMVKERIAGMKEYYAAQPTQLTQIQKAEQHVLAGQWKTGAQLLNSLSVQAA